MVPGNAVDGDEGDARLDQATCQESTLAKCVPAVAVADQRRLRGDVEGVGHGLASQHFESTLVIGVEVADPRIGVATEPVHRLENAAAVLQSAQRDVAGNFRFLTRKDGSFGSDSATNGLA